MCVEIRKVKAFTLLEVLASLFIFSMMVLGIISTMRQTTNLSERLKIHRETTLSGAIAMDRIQRDLQMAINEPMSGTYSLFQLRELGGRPQLTFSYFESPMKALFGPSSIGIKVAQYELVAGEDNLSRVFRSERAYDENDAQPDPNAIPQVLAAGVLNFRVEAYDARSDRWLKEWDSRGQGQTNRFPKLVRITLETTDPKLAPEKRNDQVLTFQTTFPLLNEVETR